MFGKDLEERIVEDVKLLFKDCEIKLLVKDFEN